MSELHDARQTARLQRVQRALAPPVHRRRHGRCGGATVLRADLPGLAAPGHAGRIGRTSRATSSSRSSCAAAADGLSLCVPFFDANYYAGRPTIAIPRPDSTAANRGIALDNNFAFPAGDGRAHAGVSRRATCSSCTRPARSIHRARTSTRSGSWRSASRAIRTSRPAGWAGTWRRSRRCAPTRRCARSASRAGWPKTLVGAPRTLPIPDPANFAIGGRRGERATERARLAA